MKWKPGNLKILMTKKKGRILRCRRTSSSCILEDLDCRLTAAHGPVEMQQPSRWKHIGIACRPLVVDCTAVQLAASGGSRPAEEGGRKWGGVRVGGLQKQQNPLPRVSLEREEGIQQQLQHGW